MLSKLTIENIFLVDGLGALISAVALGLVLPILQDWIGLPIEVLYFLAIWALLYSLYSFTCHRLASSERSKWLPRLIYLNLLYCLSTVSILIYFSSQIEVLGLLYFIGEIAIIIGLVALERQVHQKSFHQKEV